MINMPLEFETKKVPIETLGEYLSEVRNHLNLTLEEVAQKTGVYEKFIFYLESGKYQSLPPDVYVLGFLKKLAKVYSISEDSLLEQYKKERGIVEHVSREKIAPTGGWKQMFKQITITPKLMTITGSVAVGVLAFFYIVVQVFAINKTPALEIIEPKPDAVVQGTTVTVIGKTEPGISISINGQNVFVQQDGAFQTTIGVAPGQKELKVEAQNKFGKKNEQLLALRVEESSHVAGAQTTVPSELQLELQFNKATRISVVTDNVQMPEELVPEQGVKTIIARDKITVTTSDAGNTIATLNGKLLGPLGKNGQKLTIPFTKEAGEFVSPTPTLVPTVTPTPTPAPVKPKPSPTPTPVVTPSPTPTMRIAPDDRWW